MANFTVKPAAGQNLKIQRHTGADALTIDTHGNMQVSGTITTGTMTNAVSVPQEVIKKFHHFTSSTRSAGAGGAFTTPFTYTTAFTPIDPVKNSFHIHGNVPAAGNGQDHTGYGLRFEMTAANARIAGIGVLATYWDFIGKGSQYHDVSTATLLTHQGYNFVIGKGILPAGTFTIKHLVATASSNMAQYNVNSSDDGRMSQQTQSELMIIEYANI